MPSARGPAAPLAMVLAAALFGLIAVLASGAAVAHPYHLMGGNADTGSPQGLGVPTSAQKPLAQSFQVSRPFTLTRVALNVSDLQTPDTLILRVVADSAGFPEGAILAEASTASGPTFTWVNFDLNASVNLTAGVPYWIVANSTEQNQNRGYAWWNSGYDANSTGTAAYWQGNAWILRPDDFAFLLYGWFPIAVTFAHLRAAPTALAGAETSFFVDINVSGLDPAYNVTVDYWYPSPDLAFQRDSTGASGLTFARDRKSVV